MEFTEKALILKVGRFREADLWVRFISPEKGMLTGFAFGGAKSVRRFCGCLDALNQVLFRIKRSRRGEYLNLEEGRLLKSYCRLRSDPGRLGPAVNCLKFFEAVSLDPDDCGRAYELAVDMLDVYEDDEEVSSLFPVLFRARLVFGQGYAPTFGTCSRCGKDIRSAGTESLFQVEEGRVLCPSCLGRTGRVVRLDPETLELLDEVLDKPPRDWREIRPGGTARRQCYDAVDNFVRYHLGLSWDRGRFRKC
jgi:DNA repair protein RecO (recombination protein O)